MNKKSLWIVIFLGVLVFSVGIVYASRKPTIERYFVKTNNPAIKSFINVRYNFPNGFSAELTSRQVKVLKSLGIKAEKVGIYHTLPPDKCGDGTCQGFESPESCPQDCGTGSGISVSWVNPTDGETVSKTLTVQINATDSDGSIEKVEWKVDSDSYRTADYNSNTGYYEDSWNTSKYSEGGHDLTAEATDNDANTGSSKITVTVDNKEETTEPRVSDQTPYGIEQIYNDSSIEKTSGGSGVDVAILDTGVDTDHPDLKARIEQCVDFTAGGPFNTKIKTGECGDKNGHGTHTAGTALADAGSDNLGIYGVAPESDLYAYRVLDSSGSGYADDIAKAIRYAADNDAEVISMSLGGDSQSSLIADAVDYARKKGTLVIAAAGNDGSELKIMDYPGADPDVVGVAAIDSSYVVPDFSSRGVNDTSFQEAHKYVEVAAAGVSVTSCWNDGGYNTISGTSMATPHVSGFAAKVWASGAADVDGNGAVTDNEVRTYIQNRASYTDIIDGKYAREGYDPAAGIGLPTVK